MEDKFNEKDMIKFLTWVNVRCELTCWLGEYIFKGVKYNSEEIYKIYMETYFEKQI